MYYLLLVQLCVFFVILSLLTSTILIFVVVCICVNVPLKMSVVSCLLFVLSAPYLLRSSETFITDSAHFVMLHTPHKSVHVACAAFRTLRTLPTRWLHYSYSQLIAYAQLYTKIYFTQYCLFMFAFFINDFRFRHPLLVFFIVCVCSLVCFIVLGFCNALSARVCVGWFVRC